jgi:hypothetical protein
MPPDNPLHENQPPKQEALQYITYSAKELLYMLNQKVDDLDSKMDAIAIEHARLDARYVSQAQFLEAQREMVLARRFAIASTIASVGALGTFIGLLTTSLGG